MPGNPVRHAVRVTMWMEAEAVSANLPETVAEGAVVLPAPPRVVGDLARDLTQAAAAVRAVSRGGRTLVK